MSKVEAGRAVDRAARKRLGEMLIEEEFITAEQLENALAVQKSQGGKLGEILVNQGLIKDEDLAAVFSIQLNVPIIDLKSHMVQPEVLRLIPEDMARKHTLIPLDVVEDALVVVMAYPDDIHIIEDIKAQSKMRVDVTVGIPSDIEKAIDLHYRSSGEIEKQLSQITPPVREEVKITSELVAKTPIAQTLDLIVSQAVRDRASDIHIEPHEDRLRVRYRIDGILHDIFSLPLSVHVPLVSRIKILAEMNIAEQRRPQDGQFSINAGNKDVDIRAASMQTVYGERVTLRILDKSLPLFTLSNLGFLDDMLKKYRAILHSPFGLILVSGPTGSGKTTTLYASINQLDQNERNIMTIEDPIEYRFKDITQTEVNPKAGITFAGGLRAIMRHDPDVILIGEIRDKDTAATAIQATLTGHLVLSSVHANDAVGVLFRLMDLGIEPYLVSLTVVGIVAQRMVRRVCSRCSAPCQPSAEERIAYEEELEQPLTTVYGGTGCNLCANTGYHGRTGLYELLVMSEEIKRMSLSNASASEIRMQALREGMVTMKRDGMLKAKEGITSVSEVLRSVFAVG